ncbi:MULTISPECIES: hypothetical protein [Alteribacter]|uniref:Uncharacterized protein n=1 Tax=Alteribacter keqinensis TaxID=2483800 RepID=A0A3M7U0B2_9BACI|nr:MULTISPECIES: hypothetical protein [Alteribacter]MBM7096330.1 hypothetical protein [Alteribacter salitolerans]RNA70444.1 hypothetical protein EBO34_11140 [Alteribacter keqinensis]
MSTKKKVYFLIGACLLLALTILLSYFYSQDDFAQPMPADLSNPPGEEGDMDQAETAVETEDSDDLSEEDSDVPGEWTEEEDGDNEEISEAIQSALSETGFYNTNPDSRNENSYYYHFLLNQDVRHNLEDSGTSSDEREEDARYQARELMVWKDIAAEEYDWEYNENQFISFVNSEDLIQNDSQLNRQILRELREEDEDLFIRHAETKYLRSFIWSGIQDSLQEEEPQEDGEDDEAYENRLYRQLSSKIMDRLE